MPNSLPPNLPRLKAGWSWVNLGDVCKVKGGFAFKSKDYKKEGVPLVRISNIEHKKISLDVCVYIGPGLEEKAKESLLHKGDILIALSGATTGKYGVYNLEGKAFLNQRIGRLHFNGSDKILPLFVYLYLEIIRSKILQTAYGAAQPNISPSEIADFPIPLPPLHEQKKIVEKIEELFSQLDSGVASLKKAKEQLRLYRQSVLAFAFSGKLVREVGGGKSEVGKTEMLKAAEPKVDYGNNELPEGLPAEIPMKAGWKWVKLGEVAKFSQGIQVPVKNQSKEKSDNRIRFLRIIDFTQGKQEERFIENPGEKYIVNKMDLSMVRYGATTGFICRGLDGVIANNLFRILPSEKIIKGFLFYFFKGPYFQEKLESSIKGAAMPAISFNFLNNLIFPLAPLNQQTQIVEEIEKRFSEADNLEKAIDDSLEKAERLRQSILKQAFEGKLV